MTKVHLEKGLQLNRDFVGPGKRIYPINYNLYHEGHPLEISGMLWSCLLLGEPFPANPSHRFAPAVDVRARQESLKTAQPPEELVVGTAV